MRVIGGIYRSRPLVAPPGVQTRPTSDRLRETLFNVLTNGAVDRVAGGRFLDLYAGSGAVGIEAISRGAAEVTFVEQAATAFATIQKNLSALGLAQQSSSRILDKQNVPRFLLARMDNPLLRYDVVFLDPPYELGEEYSTTLDRLGGECGSLLADGAMVIAEHRKKDSLAASYGQLMRVRLLEQGDAALSFYQAAAARGIDGKPED